MWTIQRHEEIEKRFKKLSKKWKHEVSNVFANLDTLLRALNSGAKPEQIKKLGFVHSYPNGVVAVDQRGGGKGTKLKPLRLYAYPDEGTSELHVITLGDKATQQADIDKTEDFVRELNRRKEQAAEGDEDSREAV